MPIAALITVQVGILVGCALVVGVVIFLALRARSRASARQLQAVLAEAGALGIQLNPTTSASSLRGFRQVGATRVDVDIQVATRDARGVAIESVTRGTVTTAAPCPWADAAILSVAPPMFGLGYLTPVNFTPPFPMAVFAVDPHEIHRWLPAPTREAITKLRRVESISIQAGRLTLVTTTAVQSVHDMVILTDLLAAMHEGRAPAFVATPLPQPRQGVHWGVAALTLALIFAAPFGCVAPLSADVHESLSDLVCEDGDRAKVDFRSGRRRHGTTEIFFVCKPGTGSPYSAPLLAYPTLAMLTGTCAFVALFVASALVFQLRPSRSA